MGMKPRSRNAGGAVGRALRFADFEALAGDLKVWRTPSLQQLRQEKGSGLVLDFVKGLRLSAGLIYALRKVVASRRLEVHWGHLLDRSLDSCSPECDVIIHRGYYNEWNGHDKPVMDFKFIECGNAVAVISCKSLAKTIDVDYPVKLKPYVKTVFLLSECCAPSRLTGLRKQAVKAGYSGFACLYTYDEAKGECVTLPEEWEEFVKGIEKVVDRAVSRRGDEPS